MIAETDFGYIVTDNLNNQLFPDVYANLYRCTNAPDFFIAVDENYESYFLLDPKKNKIFTLKEYDTSLQLGEECNLSKENFLRITENKKIGLLRFPDSVVLPPIYTMIFTFYDSNESCMISNGKKYALYNYTTGKTSDWFDIVSEEGYISFDDGFCSLEINHQFYASVGKEVRYMNTNGEYVVLANTEPEQFYPEESDVFPVKQGDKYGYMDIYGNISIPFIYEDAGPFKFDGTLAYVKKGGKYGFIGRSNSLSIPIIYDDAESFKDGYSKVRIGENEFLIDDLGDRKDGLSPESNQNGLWGFVNNKGKTIIDFKYQDVGFFVSGLAPVNENGKWGYISPVGTTVIDFKFDEATDFNMNLSACKFEGKWGYIDFAGNFVIPNSYDVAFSFDYSTSEAKVGKMTDGIMKYGIIRNDGTIVLETKFDDIEKRSDLVYPAKLNDKWGYILTSGNPYIDFKYESVTGFVSSMAGVKLNGKWGFIDAQGHEVIDFKYDAVGDFYGDFCPVKLGGKWGYIDKTGTLIIPAQYDEAQNFYGDKADVIINDKKCTINKEGKVIK
jgi:hypothetical protein